MSAPKLSDPTGRKWPWPRIWRLADPLQRFQAGCDPVVPSQRQPGLDQRLAEPRIVIAKHGFEPRPVGPTRAHRAIRQSRSAPFCSRSRDAACAWSVPQHGPPRQAWQKRRRAGFEDPRARQDLCRTSAAAQSRISGHGDAAIVWPSAHNARPLESSEPMSSHQVALEAHEIAEPVPVFVPGVLDKAGVGHRPSQPLLRRSARQPRSSASARGRCRPGNSHADGPERCRSRAASCRCVAHRQDRAKAGRRGEPARCAAFGAIALSTSAAAAWQSAARWFADPVVGTPLQRGHLIAVVEQRRSRRTQALRCCPARQALPTSFASSSRAWI